MTRKSILILTPQLPYPLHQGTSIRNFGLVKGLAEKGHDVHLLSFIEDNQPSIDQTPLPELCSTIHTHPVPHRTMENRLADLIRGYTDTARRLWSIEFLAKIKDLLANNQFDVVQFDGIEVAAYLPFVIDHLGQSLPDVIVAYDAHNAEYALQTRIAWQDLRNPARWYGAVYSFIQASRIRALETQICRLSNQVLAVSDADADHLRDLAHNTPINVVPNAIEVDRYQTDQKTDLPHPALVFTGKMDYRPNVDAVLWFANEILPLVKAQVPNAHFVVVGQQPHARLDKLRGRDDITLTGWVKSIRPFINAGDVYVAPLRMGSGTRLKLLQAMAMKKPIVSTQLGAEGIDVETGIHMLLADSPEDFAGAIVRLLSDDAQHDEMGQAAYRLVKTNYDWQAVIPLVEAAYGW